MAQIRKKREETGSIRIRKSPHGTVKKRVLELLLALDENEEYLFTWLIRYLVKNGVSLASAMYYIKYFPEMDVLLRTETGGYRVNKELIKKMLEELTGSSP